MQFSGFLKGIKEDTVVLLFGGHSLHTKNLPVIDTAKKKWSYYIMFSIPLWYKKKTTT